MSHQLRVLIVEDDEDARDNLVDILNLDDHSVDVESAAKPALARSGSESWDVIILDRQLPDGVADQLIPAFRQAWPNAEVIVITGYADLDGTIAALRAGAADYIIKPINPDALRATLMRIAQKRQMEEDLRRERQFAQTILETAEAIVLVLDVSGRVVRFNRYLAEITGYSSEEVASLDWFETFIPERERDMARDIFDRTVNQRESRGVVNAIVAKSGRESEIRWSNTTLKDADGCVTGVLSVGLDVSDLIKAQERVLQSERLAAIGQTMAGLAHESRNALQRIQNSLELLEMELDDKPAALKDLDKIGRASRDLRDLLEEVRTYAAPIHLDRSSVSMVHIWRTAWNYLKPSWSQRDVIFEEKIEVCEEPTSVDARRMEQLFRNLFENVLDACKDPIYLQVICQEVEGGVCITIKDNGPGMNASQRDRAFEAFYTTKPTGTGLGLAIVKRIVDAHGGTIAIAVDDGTQFDICLPRHA